MDGLSDGREVRLAGVNCPELRTPAGDAARDWVINVLTLPETELVVIPVLPRDKYGRLLAEVEVTWGTPAKTFNLTDQIVQYGQGVRMGMLTPDVI